jgi:hypothetical protein
VARFEKDFSGSAETPLTLNVLLSLLGGGTDDGRSREDAIACYLSAGEGWRDAVKRLGGAFAESEAGLKERKAD